MSRLDIHSRRLQWVLFIAATLALVVTIETCRSVTDNVLTSRRGAEETANCISACAHAANEQIRAESDLHVSHVHACDGDSVCLAQEDARHQAAVNTIQDGRKACQDGCRHQGGGSGGR